jgi:zinc and cadmium transporter
MMASPTVLLVAYCLAIALFSLVGGLLPNWVRMTHTRTQLVMSFVSGLMLGVAFYHPSHWLEARSRRMFRSGG